MCGGALRNLETIVFILLALRIASVVPSPASFSQLGGGDSSLSIALYARNCASRSLPGSSASSATRARTYSQQWL